MPNGFCPIRVPFYGFMANVSISHGHPFAFDKTDEVSFFTAGSGKSVLWYGKAIRSDAEKN